MGSPGRDNGHSLDALRSLRATKSGDGSDVPRQGVAVCSNDARTIGDDALPRRLQPEARVAAEGYLKDLVVQFGVEISQSAPEPAGDRNAFGIEGCKPGGIKR